MGIKLVPKHNMNMFQEIEEVSKTPIYQHGKEYLSLDVIRFKTYLRKISLKIFLKKVFLPFPFILYCTYSHTMVAFAIDLKNQFFFFFLLFRLFLLLFSLFFYYSWVPLYFLVLFKGSLYYVSYFLVLSIILSGKKKFQY